MHKRRHHPIIDLWFSYWRKAPLTKQCLQEGHCQAQPIKARPWIFTIQGRTLNFSCVVAPTFDTAAPCYELPSQFHLATKTRIIITVPQILASMTFSANWLHHGMRIVPLNGNSQQSFASLPLKLNGQIKTRARRTKSHPIQWSPDKKRQVELT
jgi:hypothetical protein